MKGNRRRARDPEITRTEILRAAEQEFARYGLAATRTEAIAAQTGATKSMIFYHFKSKEDLYQAVLVRAASELIKLSQMKTESYSPEQALQQLVEKLLKCLAINPNLPNLFHLEAIQNKGKYYEKIGMSMFFDKLISILQKGIAEGVFRPLEPRQTAVNIVGVCAFYFVVNENLKYLWADQQMFSQERLDSHTQEAMNLVMAGVKKM
ncbi:MAG: TetR/AcrR family transcriptional regulator [Leptolyngbya sp. SIO1D8]|nr:TetR/AcrR family transcriptional regulator [Leptolyngbya sp. SIO1D8]